MELGAQDGPNALTAESAAQSLDFWRETTQRLLSDPDASGSPDALKTYAKMAASQANLFADRNYGGEAERRIGSPSRFGPAVPRRFSGSRTSSCRRAEAESSSPCSIT